MKDGVKRRGLLTNVLVEALFHLATKEFGTEGRKDGFVVGTAQAMASERITTLWFKYLTWGVSKREALTPRPLLERMLKPWLEEVPCLTSDDDAGGWCL